MFLNRIGLSIMSRESHRPIAATDIELISELTDDFQTSLPKAVCEALNLDPLDTLRFTIHPSGDVVLSRAGPSTEMDQAVSKFLNFLDVDIARHPERLQAVDAAFPGRLRKLLGNVEIDLDTKLPPDDLSEDGHG